MRPAIQTPSLFRDHTRGCTPLSRILGPATAPYSHALDVQSTSKYPPSAEYSATLAVLAGSPAEDPLPPWLPSPRIGTAAVEQPLHAYVVPPRYKDFRVASCATKIFPLQISSFTCLLPIKKARQSTRPHHSIYLAPNHQNHTRKHKQWTLQQLSSDPLLHRE